MSGIAHQSDWPIDPGIDGVTVDHRIFVNDIGNAQKCRDVQPVIRPAIKVMDKIRQFGGFVPPSFAFLRIIICYFCDPVDICIALRIGLRNRIDDQALAMCAQTNEG